MTEKRRKSQRNDRGLAEEQAHSTCATMQMFLVCDPGTASNSGAIREFEVLRRREKMKSFASHHKIRQFRRQVSSIVVRSSIDFLKGENCSVAANPARSISRFERSALVTGLDIPCAIIQEC